MYRETKEMPIVETKTHRYARLAQAILDGCKLRPKQCYGAYFKHDGIDYMACAIGAAIVAMGKYEELVTFGSDPGRYLPELNDKLSNGRTIHDAIVIHNDQEYWSRQRIANWLLTL